MTYHWIKGDAYTDKARFIYTLKGGTKYYKTYFKSHYLRRSQRLVI